MASAHALLPSIQLSKAGKQPQQLAFGLSSLSQGSFSFPLSIRKRPCCRISQVSCQAQDGPKLVTLLGKGGAGKTTAAVLLAKYYASTGKRTCLAVQSMDRTADALLGQRLSSSPVSLNGGLLSAVRLETTKLLLEPLALLKKADARVGFSQGALEEVAGEELSVLPGMDSLLATAALERLAKPAGGILDSLAAGGASGLSGDYDVVLFDGPSGDELLRMFSSPDRSRWYLRRFRALAEKTDAGRVALPSAARLLDSALNNSSSSSSDPSRSTAQIWEQIDKVLTRAVDAFADPKKFAAYLVMQPGSQASVETALRLWGGSAQAGAHVAGALLSPAGSGKASDLPSGLAERFQPLDLIGLPQIEGGEIAEGQWEAAVAQLQGSAANVLEGAPSNRAPPSVAVNPREGTVTVFLPGFDKSEVKLSQWKGGSELLIDVGDQRRSILVPPGMRGKVTGAKFKDSFLTVSLSKS